MAAFLKTHGLGLLAFTRPATNNINQLRYRKIKYKSKKVKLYEDPKNLTWAKQLIEKHEAEINGPTKEPVEEEPAMLHLVTRIKTIRNRPYWEKETIRRLKLYGDERFGTMYISRVFKNTPEMNSMLKSVQHLLEIRPVKFPHGLPKSEEDYEHCLLKDNGEFVVKHKILPKDIQDEVKLVDENEKSSVYDMKVETIQKACRRKVEMFDVNSEYFKAKHTYEYNQDQKEFRYKGDDNIGAGRDWY